MQGTCFPSQSALLSSEGLFSGFAFSLSSSEQPHTFSWVKNDPTFVFFLQPQE